MFSVFLLACVAPSPSKSSPTDSAEREAVAEDSGDPGDPTDSGEGPAPQGWELGVPQPCAAPVEPTWTDVGDPTPWPLAANDRLPDAEPGAIALVRRGEGYALFWSEPYAPAKGIDLQTGELLAEGLASYAAGFVLGDLDGDGVDDLIVTGFAPVILWRAGQDDAWVSDLPVRDAGQAFLRDIALADYDGDGDLDGFAVYTGPGFEETELVGEYLRNDGGSFTQVALPDIAIEDWGHAFDAYPLDWDRDGHHDVYVCNDTPTNEGGNRLFVGDGDGGFTLGDAGGADVGIDCMGVTFGDLDADDDLDIGIGDSLRLYLLKQTDGFWFDATVASGLTFWVGTQMAFGLSITDLDNDGLVELVAPLSDFWNIYAEPAYPMLDEEIDADGLFHDQERLPQEAGGRTVIPWDINGDGTLDLIVGESFRAPWVLLSDGCTSGSWLEIEAPHGTVAHVTAGGLTRAVPITTDRSFEAAAPALAHVGLGSAAQVDLLVLDLPDGSEARLEAIEVNQHVRWWP